MILSLNLKPDFQHTKIRADELKLTGWCMNTAAGTVKGQVQGNTKQIQEM